MAAESSDLSSKTVLVVEDNNTSTIYFKAALQKLSIQSVLATTGVEAVSIFRKNRHIDLVLMDLNMPEMDGFEATKIMKSIRPEVPIIAQTAFVLSGEEERSMKAGCDEFLSKPIRLNLLTEMLYRYLK
ncbi:response regulator [uncultured Sunxiuqinia sp.]|uniref:response regulator n=1 Tax=uncultured Sunxiuqinia sp. TaxID=1573825 RepID=UPI002AA7A999|nr:response regulator [uncultured Sunxiuqinia sp.]